MNTETHIQGFDLERRIDHQTFLLHSVKTPAERRAACDELARLIALRSADRIEEMERERGAALNG